MRLRYEVVVVAVLASMLPFRVLSILTRWVPIWRDDSEWPVWLDASYMRYVRFDAALWGFRRPHR